MVEKYKIPSPTVGNSTSLAENKNDDGQFVVETILKSLVHNKHNDSTTTYYLLHKKWVNEQEKNNNAKQ